MNVEKFIRVLGYIVYTALWSPFIVLAIVVVPLVHIALYLRAGEPLSDCITDLKNSFMENIQHDIEFIQTGKW